MRPTYFITYAKRTSSMRYLCDHRRKKRVKGMNPKERVGGFSIELVRRKKPTMSAQD